MAQEGVHNSTSRARGFHSATAAGQGPDVVALLGLLVQELLGHGAGVLTVEFELGFEDLNLGFQAGEFLRVFRAARADGAAGLGSLGGSGSSG